MGLQLFLSFTAPIGLVGGAFEMSVDNILQQGAPLLRSHLFMYSQNSKNYLKYFYFP